MSSSDVISLVVGLAVLGLVLVRQLATRRLSESYRLSVILAVIGAVEFVDFLKGHPGNPGGIIAAVVGSLVLAAVFGVARALTVRVWRQGGQLMRKGTWITAVLWVIAVAAHYGYDDLVAGHITGKNGSSVGNATVLLYLVISLTVQQFVLLARVKRQEAAGEVPTEGPQVPVNN
jgi:uncharacterized membrane protein YhaH (DUF805 family)